MVDLPTMNTKLLKKHGAELALRAHQLSREGEGPSTIGIMLGVPFKTADGLINLGRKLAAAREFEKALPYRAGDAVIYDMPDGGSASATVVSFGGTPHRYLILRLAVPYNGQQHAIVYDRDWSRITPFGNNLFVAL